MQIKLLSVAMTIFIILVSGCANSGDKWSRGDVKKSDSKENSWQKSQQEKDDQKKTSNSYWTEEGRY